MCVFIVNGLPDHEEPPLFSSLAQSIIRMKYLTAFHNKSLQSASQGQKMIYKKDQGRRPNHVDLNGLDTRGYKITIDLTSEHFLLEDQTTSSTSLQ